MSAIAQKLTPTQFALTAASVFIAVLPHLLRLPPVFALLVLGLLVGRVVQRAADGARIPALVKLPLVVLVPLLVILHYGNVFGREPGSALACAMLALKLIETETRRDARSAIAFSCFVLMSALLFDSGMGFTLLLFAALALFLATLRELELQPQAAATIAFVRARASAGLRMAGGALLAALPLTLCVFVFLPRLGSPLWGAPTDGAIGHSGLGDSMDPGELQQLLIDDSPAFRVSFDGALPQRSKLYWRGPVLTRFDGRVWARVHFPSGARRRTPVRQTAEVVNYEVSLEPSDRRWLLALDVPLAAPEGAARGADMSLVAVKPVDQLTRYRVSSALRYELGSELDGRERARDLALPPGFDPRSRQLAAQWHRDLGDDDAIIRAALNCITRISTYTLAAPSSAAIRSTISCSRRARASASTLPLRSRF